MQLIHANTYEIIHVMSPFFCSKIDREKKKHSEKAQ